MLALFSLHNRQACDWPERKGKHSHQLPRQEEARGQGVLGGKALVVIV